MLAAGLAAVAIMAPGLASAHSKDGNEAEHAKTFGIEVSHDSNFRANEKSDDDNFGRDISSLPGLFYKGTVTAVSDSGFTMNTRINSTLTVTTSGAKLVRIPRTVITLSDIQVGDKVFVTGTKTDSSVAAFVVYDMSANIKPAKVKGSVTEVNGTTLTVENKKGVITEVATNGDTQIMAEGQPATLADIGIGTKVKIFGLWDSILNIFNALKIVLK